MGSKGLSTRGIPMPTCKRPAAANAAGPLRSALGRRWLSYSLVTAAAWGTASVFDAPFVEHPTPDTLLYVAWALLLVPLALYLLSRNGWKLQHDARAVTLGMLIGVLGACGQMALFHAAHSGPASLILPIVALAPAVTIGLSMLLLAERTGTRGAAGIAVALLALPFFDHGPGMADTLGAWFYIALAVVALWGLQAFMIKLASRSMDTASIFFYLTLSAVLFIPVALAMTDFSRPVEFGPSPATLAQALNALGALSLVYAYSSGKALLVAPLVGVATPLFTALLTPLFTGLTPGPHHAAAIVLALAAAVLLAVQSDKT